VYRTFVSPRPQDLQSKSTLHQTSKGSTGNCRDSCRVCAYAESTPRMHWEEGITAESNGVLERKVSMLLCSCTVKSQDSK